MKTPTTLLFIFLTLNLFGQKEAQFEFFDACKQQVVDLEFDLWNLFSQRTDEPVDSIKQYTSKDKLLLDQFLYYLNVTTLEGDWKSMFIFDIFTEDLTELNRIYLYKLRKKYNETLQTRKYFYCDELANGNIVEMDSNGTIRATGTFKDGIANGKVQFFSPTGTLILMEKYRNGELMKLRKHRP